MGQPPKAFIVRRQGFLQQAEIWDHPRGVIAKVEWHRGELFLRAGFIVTNLTLRREGVVQFYLGLGNDRSSSDQVFRFPLAERLRIDHWLGVPYTAVGVGQAKG